MKAALRDGFFFFRPGQTGGAGLLRPASAQADTQTAQPHAANPKRDGLGGFRDGSGYQSDGAGGDVGRTGRPSISCLIDDEIGLAMNQGDCGSAGRSEGFVKSESEIIGNLLGVIIPFE